jgi:valyl-tRNA synthetase
MQDAVRSGATKILPERFDKTYFHWIDNLRDWNISRQIWFGHRVPAWYRDQEIFVGLEAPEGDGWKQDDDTFDTWFSSGLWTFSTLGWPEKMDDLKRFHPTSVLETGYDILFFWVARMILMSTYLLGEVPFKTVYLHGLVRDEQGRKMSKSLDNIIDPLDMIGKFGADATRLSLVIGSTPGNDSKLSEEKVAGYRNFTNKLWNISRFVLASVSTTPNPSSVEEGSEELSFPSLGGGEAQGDSPPAKGEVEGVTLADRWILSRLDTVVASVTRKLDALELSSAGEELRDFTWNDFADWYLEIAKIQKGESTDRILEFVLEAVLKMWHPFMPFVTEQIWSSFREGMLIVADWPASADRRDDVAEVEFARIQATIVEIRNMRATQKIEPAKKVSIVVGDASLLEHVETIKWLARVEDIAVGDQPGVQLVLGSMDMEAERKRLSKEYDELVVYVASMDEKLANTEFIAKAPEKVVVQMRTKRNEAVAKLVIIQEQLKMQNAK